MRFAGVVITQESIEAARQWFADNADACIDEARSGRVFVNGLDRYVESCQRRRVGALAGEYDGSLAFMQRAHFMQTGESVALLP